MNKDRYLKALAAEVDASVEALLSDSPDASPVRPAERAVERRAAPRDINTVLRERNHHLTQSALFPGVSPTISRFDTDND